MSNCVVLVEEGGGDKRPRKAHLGAKLDVMIFVNLKQSLLMQVEVRLFNHDDSNE